MLKSQASLLAASVTYRKSWLCTGTPGASHTPCLCCPAPCPPCLIQMCPCADQRIHARRFQECPLFPGYAAEDLPAGSGCSGFVLVMHIMMHRVGSMRKPRKMKKPQQTISNKPCSNLMSLSSGLKCSVESQVQPFGPATAKAY